MSTIADKIKSYKEKGAVEKKSTYAPVVFLSNGDMVTDKATGKKVWEGEERYLEGKLVGRALVPMSEGDPKPVYELVLIDTDAPIKIKAAGEGGKKEYVDAKAKPGDVVTVFASANLDRALRDAKAGSKVLIVYRGQEMTRTKFGNKNVHKHEVYDMRDGTEVLQTEDRSNVEKKEEKAPAGKPANDDNNW